MPLAVLFALLPLCQQLNRSKPVEFTLSGNRGDNTYSAKFKQENFQPRGRKLEWLEERDIGTGRKKQTSLVISKHPGAGDYGARVGFVSSGKLVAFRGDDSGGDDYSHPVGEVLERRTEVTSIQVFLNGKRIFVPKSLYWDLLDPHLGKKNCRARMTLDGQTLLVGMDGSDGAGSYSVVWTFRAIAKHTRVFADIEDFDEFWKRLLRAQKL